MPTPNQQPAAPSRWVDDRTASLFTDLYELTMLRSYVEHGHTDTAVFDLFVRKLPYERNYLVACGLDGALHFLEHLHFPGEALAYLESLDAFHENFVDYLSRLRFTGDVYAMPEGTPVFPNEPILEVVAPLPEAQLVETFLLNQVQFQTMAATKARRVVTAAQGHPVVDFGGRRAHGTDAAVKGARAFYVSGLAATSNLMAGQAYGIPVMGTMAHSFIETFDDEVDAFAAFMETYPETVLLVDTYDTLAGIGNVIHLADRQKERFQVRGVRLDSGDLFELALSARSLLNLAGLEHVEIFASGGLDEWAIRELLSWGAPIDGFGVGTALSVSDDAPALDSVYKLVSYAGHGRMKLSSGKTTLPGRKQVFRFFDRGQAVRDVIALDDEQIEGGTPLLTPVMKGGKRLGEGRRSLEEIRAYAQQAFEQLPPAIQDIDPAEEPYPVALSDRLQAEHDRVREELKARVATAPSFAFTRITRSTNNH